MSKLEIIDGYVARLLMVSFFFPLISQVQVVAAVSIYFAFRVFIARLKVPPRNYLLALLISSVYLLYLFSVPLTPHEYQSVLSGLLGRNVSLLLMPFAFAIIAPFFKEVMMKEMVYFVYACFISSTAGNADYMYHYWAGKTVLPTLNHVEYRMFFEAVTLIHPTYMSVYLGFSICVLLFADELGARINKYLKYAMIYVMLIYLMSLLAKSPLIAMGAILCHFGYMHRRVLYRYKVAIAGGLLSLAGVCYFIPFFRQRLGEMASLFKPDKAGTLQYNSVDVRRLIWHIDTQMIGLHWLTGVGPGRMIKELQEHYFFYSIANAFNVTYYDPHNEYFSVRLSFGLLGIAVFVSVLMTHIIKAVRVKNYLYLYLLVILYVTFFTETMLSRQRGVVFYAVFTSLFFFSGSISRKPRQF